MKPKFSIDALKNKIKSQNEKKNEGGQSQSFGDMYPFWKIEEGQQAVIRVLPFAGQEDGDYPFVQKLEHILSINGEDKKIPCRKMYGAECPICDLSRKYYKAEGKQSVKGKYYYRDAKDLASIYVVKDPLPADEKTGETAQGKVKYIQLGYQVSNKYKKSLEALLNSDDEDEKITVVPWDLTEGRNFKLVKDSQGEYANYATSSNFTAKSTSLPEDFVENFEPVDLKKYLPADPGAEKVQRMLDAHLTGGDYEEDGESHEESHEETPVVESKKPAPKAKPAVTEDDEPVVESKKPAAPAAAEEASEESEDEGDDDFLAKLRRNKKAGK